MIRPLSTLRKLHKSCILKTSVVRPSILTCLCFVFLTPANKGLNATVIVTRERKLSVQIPSPCHAFTSKLAHKAYNLLLIMRDSRTHTNGMTVCSLITQVGVCVCVCVCDTSARALLNVTTSLHCRKQKLQLGLFLCCYMGKHLT